MLVVLCFDMSIFGGCGVGQGSACGVPGQILVVWCGVGDCVLRDPVGSVVELRAVCSGCFCHGSCGFTHSVFVVWGDVLLCLCLYVVRCVH